MTEHSVTHNTFVIERTYPAAPERVFAAFASVDAKAQWFGAPRETLVADPEFDFRVGGHERFGFGYQGISYRYEGHYYDIVQDQRIIYSYEMYGDDARISVSVATIEFAAEGGQTVLTWTEQGAYLDGFDGAEAPLLRREGIGEMLDGLAKYLA